MTNCAGFYRHWYSFYRAPGLRSPVCVRCGEPNPQPLTKDEWDTLLQHRKVRGWPFQDAIENAIRAHVEESDTGKDRHCRQCAPGYGHNNKTYAGPPDLHDGPWVNW